MATYPRDRAQFLVWSEAHAPLWSSVGTTVGLTTGQINEYKSAVDNLRQKVTAQQVAKDALRAATEAAADAERDTKLLTSDLVRSIRAFATNSANPAVVYQTAQIPAPSSGTPVPPPGQPTDFRIELNSNGSITIRWKCANPEGSGSVVYFVQRKLLGETNFSIIGGSGEKAFTDETLPVGIDGATYIISAQRGQVSGQPSRQLTVTFGSGGAERAGLKYAEGNTTAKLAA